MRASALRPELLLLAVLVAAGFGWTAEPPPASATEPAEPEAIRSALDQGIKRQSDLEHKIEKLSREIESLRTRQIAVARAVQANEAALSRSEAQLAQLKQEEGLARASLHERRQELAVTLAALERLAQRPPESLIAYPAPPHDVIRGAVVLREVLSPLMARVGSLRSELTELARLSHDIAREQEERNATAAELGEKRAELDALVAKTVEMRQRVQSDSQAAAERVKDLAAKAQDVRDLIGRLNADRANAERADGDGANEGRPGAEPSAPERQVALLHPPAARAPVLTPPKPFSAAKGRLGFPAQGHIARRFGEPTEAGLKSRGIVIDTVDGAQVVAPYDGQVAFAGPFRGYGQLLIIAQGEGYHILLAGLSRIDCVVGQWLLAGEPVGVMGPAENSDPQLYVELRYDGEPINPLPWLAARDEKVSG
ncbi:MAG: peptidoglycan DD-metalloendopeptidase family protein [Alphaproteobacteria bacterium]